jgi:predicted ATPase
VSATRARAAGGLLEREEELARIDAGLEAATEGRGSLILVEGPAGIGKSELLAEARSRALDAGVEVLAARGGELEQSFGFGVVRRLLGSRLADAGAAERDELLRDAVALALPALGIGDRP